MPFENSRERLADARLGAIVFLLPPPKMKNWTRDSSERVGEFRVFGVDRHVVRDGEGTPRGDFFTFACRDWCNVIAITPDDEVVLVWQYRFGTDLMSLEIPGGVIDDDESPIESSRRELLEETGYAANALEPFLVVEPNPALQGNRCFTFLALGARQVAEPRLDEQEEIEIALVPARHLAKILDDGHVTHALVHSALEAYLRRGRGPR